MKQEIRHRRLEAFFKSKVLNALSILVLLCLFLMVYTDLQPVSVICCGLAFASFIGYALWLWIKKPKSIIINNWLSGTSEILTFYYLVVVAIGARNGWWFIVPAVAAVVALLLTLTGHHDERYDI